MGLFDFLKTDSKSVSVDLTDFKFISDDHTRFENGRSTNANNKGAWRGIRIKSSDNITFFVSIYNMNENHPIWGNNIQMAEKKMKLIEENNNIIILRGFGIDSTGASFADYGLTLHKSNKTIHKITLHMHDRKVDIVYENAPERKQTTTLDNNSDFENFKIFIDKWNTRISMDEKMRIAVQSDNLNNQGVDAYNDDDVLGAIRYYEQAIAVMPNNDDALTNLRICYSEIGKQDKVREVVRKLNYLQQ